MPRPGVPTITVECDICQAKPGEPCKGRDGKDYLGFHHARNVAAAADDSYEAD